MPNSPAMLELAKNGSPIRTVEDWFLHAPPKGDAGHWLPGHSALECAKAWCEAGRTPCVPLEIVSLLDSHPDTSEAEVLSGIPEYRIRFDKVRGEPRNSDLVVEATHGRGRLAISIEAKVNEP